VVLDGFESQTSQTPSQFFPISSNPYVLGITEQALIIFPHVLLRPSAQVFTYTAPYKIAHRFLFYLGLFISDYNID
jgi:hypothetical protein